MSANLCVCFFSPLPSNLRGAGAEWALTSVMSIRDAMVRRVLGEKWLVIMILMPASQKVSWWGYADSSSSTISTDGFLWWFAAGHTHHTRHTHHTLERDVVIAAVDEVVQHSNNNNNNNNNNN